MLNSWQTFLIFTSLNTSACIFSNIHAIPPDSFLFLNAKSAYTISDSIIGEPLLEMHCWKYYLGMPPSVRHRIDVAHIPAILYKS